MAWFTAATRILVLDSVSQRAMGMVNTEEREEGQRGMDLICVRCEEPNCGRGGT